MAELTPFVAGRLRQGRGGGQAAGRGAQLVQLPGTQAGQGLSTLGGSLVRFGQVLDARNNRFEQAKANILGIEGLSAFLQELQDAEDEIGNDASLFPTDRADALQERLTPRLEAIKETIPTLGQPAFLRGANNAFLRSQRNLRAQGRKESVARGRQAAGLILSQLRQGMLSADNEVDRAQIEDSARGIVGLFVDQGLFTPEEGATLLQHERENVAKLEIEFLTQTNPREAVAQLQEGFEGNPDIAPAELPVLLDKAMAAFDESLNRAAALERLQQTRLTRAQGTRASEVRTDLYRADISLGELSALQDRVNAERDRDELSEGDHAEFLKAIETRTRKILDDNEDEEQEDTARELALRLHLAETTDQIDDVRESIIEQQEDLSASGISDLMGAVEGRRVATYFENRRSYRNGVSLIQQAAFPAGMVAIALDKIDSKTKRTLRTALDVYRSQMQRIAERGFDAVDDEAMQRAEAIRNMYFQSAPMQPSLPPELDIKTQTFGQAVTRLNQMDLTESEKDILYEAMEAERAALREKLTKQATDIETAARAPLSVRERVFGVSDQNLFPGDTR